MLLLKSIEAEYDFFDLSFRKQKVITKESGQKEKREQVFYNNEGKTKTKKIKKKEFNEFLSNRMKRPYSPLNNKKIKRNMKINFS